MSLKTPLPGLRSGDDLPLSYSVQLQTTLSLLTQAPMTPHHRVVGSRPTLAKIVYPGSRRYTLLECGRLHQLRNQQRYYPQYTRAHPGYQPGHDIHQGNSGVGGQNPETAPYHRLIYCPNSTLRLLRQQYQPRLLPEGQLRTAPNRLDRHPERRFVLSSQNTV